MTNSTPWQATVNANNFSNLPSTVNNLTAVKKADVAFKPSSFKMVVQQTKRYSIDDNGGGYKGL